MKTLVTIKRTFDNGDYFEEATIYLNKCSIEKLKKDAIKINNDGTIKMRNGDEITIEREV